MKRNRMRRFFQQKQYAIASLILFVAIAGMTGVYISGRITNQNQNTEIAEEEKDLSEEEQTENVAVLENNDMDLSDDEEVTSVTSVIKPEERKPENETTVTDKDTSDQTQETKDKSEEKKESADTEQKQETTTQAKASNTATLHFSPDTDLGWPLQGDVILNYSMDQTVYFATLEQYKYNPALIIAGEVNDPVKAAATGKITDISVNEETGVTVTMDLGDGYSAIYGQLKEVLYKEGAIIEAGNAIGYVAEPTKYYSVEGSNLYFELLKDGEPVNPMQYIE